MFQVIIILSALMPTSSSAILVSSISCSQREPAEVHVQKAREAIDNNRHAEALDELNAALKVRKDSPGVYVLLAEVYRREGKIDEAIKHARNAIKYDPNTPEAHYLLGLLLFQKNKLKDAQQALEAGLNKAPRYAPLYVLKGDLELATSTTQKGPKAYDPKLDTAIKSYEEALRLASPSERYVPIVRDRLTGLKNYIEFILHEDDTSYVKAKPLNNPEPEYTTLARRMGVQGKVRMGVSISERGEISSVILLSNIGYGLDEEAVRAARKLKFSPATRAGKPVPYWSRVIIEFRIR